MSAWQLTDYRKLKGDGTPKPGYLSIELDGIRIADVFPDAGMYRGKVGPQWIIEQAQRIVDAMNAIEGREVTL
jgi:hypothetical protein